MPAECLPDAGPMPGQTRPSYRRKDLSVSERTRDAVSLWHALHRECSGAWRSMRYDLAARRAIKLAGAFTEEFAPSGPPVPTPSRLVPLAGVALLLAGGAAGAFVAINGGLAAVNSDPPAASPPAAAAPETAPTYGTGTATPGAPPSQAPPPRRVGAYRSPEPGPVPAPAISPPVTEGSLLPTDPSVEASSAPADPTPSASESDGAHDGAHRSRGPRPRR
jgi:hypothetical protein